MANKNLIGLDKTAAKNIAEKLEALLANYQMFYANVRGFHWNISGEKFFELHTKFEELYNDAFLKTDEIAERILTLGFAPQHLFSSYIKNSKIAEAQNTSDATTTVKDVLDSFKTLLVLERDILSLASEAGDEGTTALMSDYIREQEKLVWMYSAYLK